MINTLNNFILKPKDKISRETNTRLLYKETEALIKRLIIQVKRRPSTFIAGLIQPLLWLILFGALFQNAPVGLLTSNIQYNIFLSPGIIIFTAFTGSINAGLPLIFDREFGFLNRLLIAPMISRDSLLLSSIIFNLLITLAQTCTIILCNKILFKNIQYNNHIPFIFFITFLIALSISSLSIYLACTLPGHIEFLAFILIINLPILFSSTALAPLSFMPYWLQIIASLNPMTYAIENIRYVMLNNIWYHDIIVMKTVWCNLNFSESITILICIDLISFAIVKKLISYKFE
uniref:ABC-2 type transporter n=1 Tax=Asparagopsis taxiformis TaxID=260499 RepID=A0A1C9CCH1_9FLOR|nr:ABC-2 type transporter [Asparagopsis taxiformis]AOM66052.1 ABC-2 type transporter [Asparagopsis taxiformis]